jgi:hypothetical protein
MHPVRLKKWSPISVILDGNRIAVKKPTVRLAGKEVELERYSTLQGYDMLQERVAKRTMDGVSTRSYGGLINEVAGGMVSRRAL